MIGRPWLAAAAILLVSVPSSHAQPEPVTVIRAGTLIDPQAGRTRTNQLVVKNEIAR
jgi:hypothetical protein